MPEFIEKEYSSVLNKKKYIDSWFWDRYSINPYNGCLFGCIYCNSRSSKYRMPEDFENDIFIKGGLSDQLFNRLSKSRSLLPDVVALSGVTDPYQPAEKKYENTKKCLEVLNKFGFPVHIITKSDLVLRDLEILEAIGQKSWCTVSVSITTTDTDKAKFLENRSPSPEKRFKVIEEIKKKAPHVQAGVLAIPVVPFFTDSREELESLYQRAKATKADYLLFGGGMTMHEGQAEFFLEKVLKSNPRLIPKYEELFGFKYGSGKYEGATIPSYDYMLKMDKLLLELNKKYQLPYRIKRFIPKDYRRVNYIIAERLLNEAYENQIIGKEYEKLFWAGQNIQNLDVSLQQLKMFEQLATVKNVEGEILKKVEDWLREFE